MTKDVLLLLAEWLDAREKETKERVERDREAMFGSFSFPTLGVQEDSKAELLLKRVQDTLNQLIDMKVEAQLQELINKANERAEQPSGYHPCYPEQLGRS